MCRWWYERRIAFVNGDKRSALLSEVSLLSAATALGTNPVAVKYALGDIPPLPFVALRFTWAGLVVMAFLLFLGSGVRLKRKHVLPMAGLGLIGVGLNNVMFTFGVALTSASNTALIYATPPLWGLLVGFALGLERPRMRGVLGILLAIFGVGISVYGGWVAGACRATFWSRGRRSAGAPTRPSLSFCSATTRRSRSPATRCYSRSWPCYLSPL